LFGLTLYEDIQTALVVDLIVLSISTILLLRYGRLAHSHPAIAYLLFHTLVVPSRLLAVMAGAETLFTGWGIIFEPVTPSELARAASMADMILIVMTIAWVRASIVDAKRQSKNSQHNNTPPVTLSLSHIWRVVIIAFPIGMLGLMLLGNVPGIEKPQIDLGEWQESSWIGITMSWAGLALLALIYWYGFRWWIVTPMIIDLLIMAIQGYHRFRVIIPLILMLQIYLDRRQKKWPSAIVLIPIIVAVLLFFPMKTIGKMAQSGATFTEIRESSSEIIRDAMSGQAADQSVLDQLASTLTLVDRAGKTYYGSTYLALLTSPIPRQLWPEKPGLAEYVWEYSTPSRPMAEVGMITTLTGELYLNFGYIGMILVSYLTAYGLASVYFRAYRSNYFSVLRFGYLLVACNLIQVYRDGLMSLLIFTVVNMMPLATIVILHFFKPVRHTRESAPLHGLPSYPR
jgi:oligosaccharide repeat unit polymerase